MSILLAEKETILNYNSAESLADVYTHDTRLIKKMKELCDKHQDDFKFIKKDGQAYYFKVTKKYVTVNAPRIFSEDAKQRMSERMKQLKS